MKFDDFPTGLLVKCAKKVMPDAVKMYFTKSSSSFLQRQQLLQALHEASVGPTDDRLTPILSDYWDKMRKRFYTPSRELLWENDHIVLTSQIRQYVKKTVHVIDEKWTFFADQQIDYQVKTSPVLRKEDLSFFHAYSSYDMQNHSYLVRFCTELMSFSSQPYERLHYVCSSHKVDSRWDISFSLPAYPEVVLTATVNVEDNELLRVRSSQLRGLRVGLNSLFPDEVILHFVKEEAPTRLEMLFH